jgi:putative ABC transport system permease protein
MRMIWKDLRFALRMLTKNRSFTVVAVITLALGIGANAAIFSVVDAVLIKPLPYADPDRLLVLSEKPPSALRNTVSVANFLDWQRLNNVFTHVAATTTRSFNLSGKDQPQKIPGMLVTANYFVMLGVTPALGRTFQTGGDQPGQSNLLILTHRLWQQRFGGDPNLLGKEVMLDGQKYVLIGVLKPDSNFDRATAQLYAPLTFDANRSDRRSHFLRVFARLKPDFTIDQAKADLNEIAAAIAQQYPDTNQGWGITVDKLRDRIGSPQLRQTIWVLFGAVVFVLLIACTNLANLLLARTAGRWKEISIRAALGAAKSHLLRQFLTETILLAVVGGTFGLGLAIWLIHLFSSLMPPFTLPPEADLSLDYRAVIFAFGISLLTGLIIGLIPAWQAARPNLSEALKEGGKNSTAASNNRFISKFLIVSEVSMAFVLLVGSVLLVRNLLHLSETKLGFQPENVLTLHVSLPDTKYKTPAELDTFFQEARQRIAHLPGILTTSTVTDIPIGGWTYGQYFEIEGQPATHSRFNAAHYQRISPDYFRTFGIPILAGRDFTLQDRSTTTPVVMINETFARRFFANEDPLGKRLVLGEEKREIVGVAGNVHVYGLGDQVSEENPELFVPYAQDPFPESYFAIRTDGDPMQLANAVQREIHALDNDQPITNVQSMQQAISETMADEKFNTSLIGMFAVVAVMLAAIGIYGLISYVVAQHTREIGIRLALGAQRAHVLKLIIGQGMWLAGIGIVVGLGLAFVSTRLLGSLLHGVSTTDRWSFMLTPLLLAAIALLACYIPARRATKLDPLVALRSE